MVARPVAGSKSLLLVAALLAVVAVSGCMPRFFHESERTRPAYSAGDGLPLLQTRAPQMAKQNTGDLITVRGRGFESLEITRFDEALHARWTTLLQMPPITAYPSTDLFDIHSREVVFSMHCVGQNLVLLSFRNGSFSASAFRIVARTFSLSDGSLLSTRTVDSTQLYLRATDENYPVAAIYSDDSTYMLLDYHHISEADAKTRGQQEELSLFRDNFVPVRRRVVSVPPGEDNMGIRLQGLGDVVVSTSRGLDTICIRRFQLGGVRPDAEIIATIPKLEEAGTAPNGSVTMMNGRNVLTSIGAIAHNGILAGISFVRVNTSTMTVLDTLATPLPDSVIGALFGGQHFDEASIEGVWTLGGADSTAYLVLFSGAPGKLIVRLLNNGHRLWQTGARFGHDASTVDWIVTHDSIVRMLVRWNTDIYMRDFSTTNGAPSGSPAMDNIPVVYGNGPGQLEDYFTTWQDDSTFTMIASYRWTYRDMITWMSRFRIGTTDIVSAPESAHAPVHAYPAPAPAPAYPAPAPDAVRPARPVGGGD